MKRKVGRPKKEDTEIVFVRMPKRLLAKLRKKAAVEQRPVSTTIAIMLAKDLE